MFFVSVASKELRVHVSGLESTLTGIPLNVDSKWLSLESIFEERASLQERSHYVRADQGEG
jgi:hypothetical protein